MGESVCLVRSFSQPTEMSSRETDEVNPRRVLTESVSFGRFASETLEWEKWSAFTQNRYLEEVERYTKPGSVAEKKAFFEAHFRNRASGKTTKTKTEEANVVKTIDETVCQVRKENLVDSQVPLVDELAVDELRHVEVSTAEVVSVAPSISVTDATTDVQTGEVKDTIAENDDPMAVPEDEDLDKENSTSLTKERRPSSSGSKTCSRSSNPDSSFSIGLDLPLKITRKEPLSTRKRSTSVSKNQNRSPPQPFHISISCAPSGNANKKIDRMPQNGSKNSTNVTDAWKADKKERSGPSSVHMSLSFASSARQTTKAAPKKLARKSTTQETTSSNAGSSIKPKGNEPTVVSKSRKRPLPRAAKEDSDAPKCSTRASAFRLPELPPPKSRPSDEKRKNITVGSSVSCRIPNNVQRQPSASCESISSTQSRTRAKSFTVSTPFKFRSDERAEKRKEFFKKLEEKKKKKEQSSCGFKENQNTHLASEEHKNGGFQAPMISLTSPRFRRNQTPGRENIKQSHKSPHKVVPVETTNTRNQSMEKYKRCKIHPSLTRKKSQENSSPNVL